MIGAGRVPVVLVTGMDADGLAAVTISLQWDLPRAVVAQYRIDAAAAVLHRVVSDVTGVVERERIDLANTCISCAIREDLVATLGRLADAERWTSIVACLPVAAEAIQICRVAAWDDTWKGRLRIGAVVTAVHGPSARGELLSSELLADRGLQVGADDERGLAEVGCAMIEHADLIAVVDDLDDEGRDLIRALGRPDASIVEGASGIDARPLMDGLHDHDAAEAWINEVPRRALPEYRGEHAWRIDLSSSMPFHPERFTEALETIGDGPRRSRGCFWLATRPGDICGWDGAGGQLSIGTSGHWNGRRPVTRITVTGSGEVHGDLRRAFKAGLVTEVEAVSSGLAWAVPADGLEPWLGDIEPT